MNQLNPKVTVVVEAKTGFSRLNSQFTPDEIAAKNAKKANPQHREDVNRGYTQLVLSEPRIIPSDPSGALNAEEQALQKKIKTSDKYGASLWLNNKTRKLPAIGVFDGTDDNGNRKVVPFELEGELDSGVPVTVIAHVFDAGANVGANLDTVIINSREDVKYYSGVSSDALNARGIVISGGLAPRPLATPAQSAPALPQPGSGQALPAGLPGMGDPNAQGQAIYGQGQQFAPAPGGQQYGQAPQQQYQVPAQPQPQQYQAPVPQMSDFSAQPQQPVQPATNLPAHQQGSPFEASPVQTGNLPTSQFQQQAQPQHAQESQSTGIAYDPNGNNSPWSSN